LARSYFRIVSQAHSLLLKAGLRGFVVTEAGGHVDDEPEVLLEAVMYLRLEGMGHVL
jgi:hypothetical protein